MRRTVCLKQEGTVDIVSDPNSIDHRKQRRFHCHCEKCSGEATCLACRTHCEKPRNLAALLARASA